MSVRCRLTAFRVDLRDGFPAEVSKAYAAFFPALPDAFRGTPALRSVALTPGSDVSMEESRRTRGGLFGFFGPERSVQ
jgi:hypothetical protein